MSSFLACIVLIAEFMAEAPELHARGEVFRQPPRHILLVNDDPAFVAHTVFFLSQAGHRVSAVRDGAEAVHEVEQKRVQSDQFDLLIIDIDTTRLSGFALHRRLQTMKMPVPVLILTNFVDSSRFRQVRSLLSPDIMLKSCLQAELLGYLERLGEARCS